MFDLFPYELTGLRGRGFAFALRLSRAFDRFLLRHSNPPLQIHPARDLPLKAIGGRLALYYCGFNF
jgi:hypothetical protein